MLNKKNELMCDRLYILRVNILRVNDVIQLQSIDKYIKFVHQIPLCKKWKWDNI